MNGRTDPFRILGRHLGPVRLRGLERVRENERGGGWGLFLLQYRLLTPIPLGRSIVLTHAYPTFENPRWRLDCYVVFSAYYSAKSLLSRLLLCLNTGRTLPVTFEEIHRRTGWPKNEKYFTTLNDRDLASDSKGLGRTHRGYRT